MAYVVSLQGFRPPPRFDGLPWTQVRIDESPAQSGPWTALETIPLVLDPDPSNPAVRDVTTELATLPLGWYRLQFIDASGDLSAPTEPVFAGAGIGYRPELVDIGALLRARTTDTNGAELGTFTGETRPTAAEVDRLVDQAIRDVAGIVGVDPPADTLDIVRGVVALRAAILVERSYFPEQIRGDQSLYNALRDDYKDQLKMATEAVRESAAGGKVGEIDEPQMPSFSFGLVEPTLPGTEQRLRDGSPFIVGFGTPF